MQRKRLVSVAILVLCLVIAVPVLADVPTEGIVEEGVRVPGIDLGFSRAQVEAVYGEPYYCQSYSLPDDAAFCTFRADTGGLVSVRYRGADGGFAGNSPDDRVVEIGWGEPLSGWTTTAGINPALAEADPDAVIAAYPDAEVVYLDSGLIKSVTDWLQGIEVRWSYDPYTGATHVAMSIFVPLASLPDAQEPKSWTGINRLPHTLWLTPSGCCPTARLSRPTRISWASMVRPFSSWSASYAGAPIS